MNEEIKERPAASTNEIKIEKLNSTDKFNTNHSTTINEKLDKILTLADRVSVVERNIDELRKRSAETTGTICAKTCGAVCRLIVVFFILALVVGAIKNVRYFFGRPIARFRRAIDCCFRLTASTASLNAIALCLSFMLQNVHRS